MSLILAVTFINAITPNDYWWYVRLGKDIVSSGTLPTVEYMSYTQAGDPANYQTWLAAVIFWGVYQAGGIILTALLRGALVAAFYLIVWVVLREVGAGRNLAAIVMLLAALIGMDNWAIRPQLFAYPLFALSIWVIYGWLNGKERRLWLLPLIAALWVNLHGSYPFLFLLLGAAVVFGKGNRHQLLIFSGLAFLATFLNPLGPVEWIHTVSIIRNDTISTFVSEWQPPVNRGSNFNLFFGWLLLMGPLSALAKKKPTALEWLWFLGFGWIALSSSRLVIWLTVIMAVITARMLSDLVGSYTDRPDRFSNVRMNRAVGSFILLVSFALMPGLRQAWLPQGTLPTLVDTPEKAAAWLAERPDLPGPLWGDLAFSSYLTFALPERPVWVHTRFEAFPPEHIEQYVYISNAREGWNAMLEEEGINLLLLNLNAQPALVQAVETVDTWKEVYRDDMAVIFVRAE